MAEQLTEREYQVAELIAWGAAQKEVPDLLVEKYGGRPISINTVQVIISSIYSKTGTGKATELSAWWFTHELGVDALKAPVPSIRQKLISAIFLIIIIPQIAAADLDQAVRTSRTRTPRPTRSERVERSRRREEGLL